MILFAFVGPFLVNDKIPKKNYDGCSQLRDYVVKVEVFDEQIHDRRIHDQSDTRNEEKPNHRDVVIRIALECEIVVQQIVEQAT